MLGRLEVGSAAPREIDGATCSEVVSALALITALTIDPAASTAPLAKPMASPEPAAPPPPVAPALSTLPQPPTQLPHAEPDRPKRERPAPPPVPRPPRWTAGADFTVALEAAPRPLVGGAAFAEIRSPRPTGPLARASAGYATTGPFESG